MEPFLAYRIHKDDGKSGGRLERITLDDLNEGDVVIRVRVVRHQLQGCAGRDRSRAGSCAGSRWSAGST